MLLNDKHVVLIVIHRKDIFKRWWMSRTSSPSTGTWAKRFKKGHTEAAESYWSCTGVHKKKATDAKERKLTWSPSLWISVSGPSHYQRLTHNNC
jgi:hypothetical protein